MAADQFATLPYESVTQTKYLLWNGIMCASACAMGLQVCSATEKGHKVQGGEHCSI